MNSILIMGLPGSGKTTFSKKLVDFLNPYFSVEWINADVVREQHQDWDFTIEGRHRQALRMTQLKDFSKADIVICDFICPKEQHRTLFNPDILVWMNTIKKGRFEDTNEMFEIPKEFTYEITHWNENNSVLVKIFDHLKSLK